MKKDEQAYYSLDYVQALVKFITMPKVKMVAMQWGILRNTGVNICQTGLATPKDPVVREFLSSGVLGCHLLV